MSDRYRKKEGLEFFPLDIDYFDDPKILKIEQKFGLSGSAVATRLLCSIYRNGYYYKWDADEALMFASRKVGNIISYDLLNEIVVELLNVRFFDKEIFDKKGILTSKGIQTRWLDIMIKAKRKARINPEYDLTNTNREQKYSEELKQNTEDSDKTSEDFEQSKVDKNKEEESKANDLARIENDDFKYEAPVPREATDLVEAICDYFEVKKIVTSKIYNSIDDFVRTAMHRNELTMVSLSLQKYMAYKARSQEAKHNVLNWIGTKDSHYTDGHWYTTDWDLKLKNSNNHAPIERTTTAASAVITGGKAFGDIRKRRAN